MGVRRVPEPEVRGTLTIAGGAEVQLPLTARLGAVRPGDVFYLLREPSAVWFRDVLSGGYDGYTFTALARGDSWCTQNEVGRPDEAVVIVHNTMTDKSKAGVLASQT